MQIQKDGVIILGVKENKETKACELEGVENVNGILKDFWNTINNTEKVSSNILNDDYVEVVDIEEKTVIVIHIPSATRQEKPVYINNNPITGAYKRYHDGDYKCDKKEVKVMFSESVEKSKDEMILEEFDINNIDKETLENYRIRFKVHKGDAHEWSNLPDKEFLYMIGAIDRNTNKLTLAGLLMFGNNKDIIKIKPSFFLDYREIDDFITTERWSNRITSSPDEMWSGNLWGFFSKIVNRLTADIPKPFALDKDLMRIDNTDAHKSVREGLANCLVHTDYTESGSIIVEKGPDYFKFSNPGNLRIPVEIAMQGGRSDARNVILHQMFSYLGYGERAGSGLYMINKAWQDRNWIKPNMEEELNPNRTILTLYMRKTTILKEELIYYPNNYPNNYPNKLTKVQVKILEIIRINPTITVKQISELISEVKYDAIRWNIAELKRKKIIERKGTTRQGTWIIKLK